MTDDAAHRVPERMGASALGAQACVVIPMFNEAGMIATVIRGLTPYFSQIVCVDDASSDDSARVAAACGAAVIRHGVNLGQGGALQTGLRYALDQTRAEVVVTFDADGQHHPADAAAMAARVLTGETDVVLGTRFATEEGLRAVPVSRRVLLRAAVLFTRVTTGLRLTDTHNGLRALSRPAAQRIDLRLRGMAHASEILHQVADSGLRYEEAPVRISYTDYSRAKGQSGLNALNIMADIALQRLYASR